MGWVTRSRRNVLSYTRQANLETRACRLSSLVKTQKLKVHHRVIIIDLPRSKVRVLAVSSEVIKSEMSTLSLLLTLFMSEKVFLVSSSGKAGSRPIIFGHNLMDSKKWFFLRVTLRQTILQYRQFLRSRKKSFRPTGHFCRNLV